MYPSISAKYQVILLRTFAVLAFLLSAALIAGWPSADLAAQDRAKSSSKKQGQEDPSKKKRQKEEEEDTRKPKRQVPPVGDEEGEEKPQPPAKAEGGEATPLEREAQQAKHPAIERLYRSLAKPHDVAIMSGRGSRVNIEPIPQYIGSKPKFSGELSLQGLTDQWKPGIKFPVKRNDIIGIEPYELVAVAQVERFLKSKAEEGTEPLSPLEKLQAAEKVLESVLAFHLSAVEGNQREGDGWREVQQQLETKLQRVRLDKLAALTETKDWGLCYGYAATLIDKYSNQKKVLLEVTKLLASVAKESLEAASTADKSLWAEKFTEVRKRLLLLDQQFPDSQEVKDLRKELSEKAAALVAEANKLKDPKAKKDLLETAQNIYPQLPGLRDQLLQISNNYPILYVGVHDLPEKLSPALAYTDSEKQVVELLFESLVKLRYRPDVGQRYEAGLAAGLPRLVPLGRQFELTRNAQWAAGKYLSQVDGQAVTATDVRKTVQLLSDPNWPGRIPEWANLMAEGARIEEDNYHIGLTLRQGYLDPLSLMDFKVLPGSLDRADNAEFAKNPISSGPFRYKGKEGDHLVFVANSYYENRPGKAGLPHIREIHFFHSKEPGVDFAEGRLHLLLDLPSSKCQELATVKDVELRTLPNRRIYFLAVNHRRTPLKSQALRRALAFAINREQILDDCFRAGDKKRHRALNGPYPPQSWPCNPEVPSELYKLDLAQHIANEAKDKDHVNLDNLTLTLKYPDNDPAVEKACELIRAQVQEAGIKLELQKLPPRELRRQVEDLQQYDLAYYHWDYPSEAYWLWPLFDPQATGKGGQNFLGYRNDERLAELFGQAMIHREPGVVQERTHEIHYRLYEQMPLIPLWQLDTHLAFHNTLTFRDSEAKPALPDPLLIFTDVENWKLEKH